MALCVGVWGRQEKKRLKDYLTYASLLEMGPEMERKKTTDALFQTVLSQQALKLLGIMPKSSAQHEVKGWQQQGRSVHTIALMVH